MNYQLLKLDLAGWTGLAKDALHVHIGLAIFIAVRLLWRRKGGWWLAWSAALIAALGGEALDIRDELAGNYLQPDKAHWHDIWNTMVWPTILLVVGPWLSPKPKPLESSDLADQPLEETPPVSSTVH